MTVALLGDAKVSSLSSEQMERLCEVAEEAARESIVSIVSRRGISDLSIIAGLEEAETLNMEVDVEVILSPSLRSTDARRLAEESVKAAFEAVEKYLRESGCQSNR